MTASVNGGNGRRDGEMARGEADEMNGFYPRGRLIYENSLAKAADLADFRLEGRARMSFPEGRLRLENAEDAALGQKAERRDALQGDIADLEAKISDAHAAVMAGLEALHQAQDAVRRVRS